MYSLFPRLICLIGFVIYGILSLKHFLTQKCPIDQNAVSIIYKHFHELLKRYEFAETVNKVMTL